MLTNLDHSVFRLANRPAAAGNLLFHPSRLLVAFVALVAAMSVAAARPAFAGSAATSAGHSKPSGPQPRIIVDQPVYDFGTVFSGAPIKHAFEIRNGGHKNLIIGKVMTSCGCTAAQPEKTTLAPGQATRINASINSKVEKGKTVGTITVITNDPLKPSLTLTLRGFVKQKVVATPGEIAFGNVHHGVAQTRRVEIKAVYEPKGFKLGDVSNSNPDIKVTKVHASNGHAGNKIEVALLKTMPVGSFVDTIQADTNRGPVEIDVFGTITGDLNLDPPQVSFGIVPHRQSAMSILKLTDQGSRPVRILSVTSSNPSVSAKVDPVTVGKVYKITVYLRPNTPDGQVRGQLAIKTDDPRQATLTVPFYGIVGGFKG